MSARDEAIRKKELASTRMFLAVVALAGFVWRINGAPHPFVSPALFKNIPFVAAMGVGFFSMLANLSALVFVPLLLVEVNGLSACAALAHSADRRR